MPRINLDFGLPDLRAGLMSAGTAVGSLPGQYKAMKQREEDAAELAQYAQGSPEYYDEVANQLIRKGQTTEAIRFQELARQARRTTETEETDRGKTALSRYMRGVSDKGEDLRSSRVKEGFDRIARAFGVSFEDASSIFKAAVSQNEQTRINNNLADAIEKQYPNVASAARLGDPEAKKFAYEFLTNSLEDGDLKKVDYQFGSSTDRARDAKGNLYFLSTKRNPKTGEIVVVHSPVGGAPPYNPKEQGRLQYIDRVGETASEKRQAETEQQDKKEWLKQRGEMLIDFSGARQVVEKAERAIDALENISTSGFDAALKKVTDFTGTTSADVGVFNSSVSDFILESLGQLGANPTEGERNFLLEASASLKTSNEVNEALLNRVKNTYIDIIKRGRWLVDNPKASRDEYANWMLSPQEENVITFDAAGNRVTK